MSIIDKFKKKSSDIEEVKDIEETEKSEETKAVEEEESSKEAKTSESEVAATEEPKERKKKEKKKKKNASVDAEEAEEADSIEKTDGTEKTQEDKSEETSEKSSEGSDKSSDKITKKKKKKKKAKKEEQRPEDVNIVKELLSLIIYIGIVVLLCYFIINFVGCRSRVDGDSMEPTLSDGDNLWVDKLSYTFGEPERFDVIIFNYDEDTTYVKRIIGLPGETVRIDQNGNIFITGESGKEQMLKENYGNEKIKPNYLGRANQPVYLSEDEYFVLGDNRNNSRDSRWADVGNVKMEDIVGKVVLRIYPLNKIGVVK